MVKIKPSAEASGPKLYKGMYPAVTTVLEEVEKRYLETWRSKVGRQEADTVMGDAKVFGTRIHKLAQELAESEGEAEVPEDLRPFSQAILGFLRANVAEVLETELELISEGRRFGGTLDLYCRLHDGSYAVVDYKTSKQLTREHGLQTAAYALMLKDCGLRVDQRIVVRIKKDEPGAYYVRRYPDHKESVRAFLGLLDFWWWKHGAKMAKKATKRRLKNDSRS